MLDIPQDFEYSEFDDIILTEYRIAEDDLLQVRLFTNDGAGLINVNTGSDQVSVGGETAIELRIESDGFAKFPIFGRLYVKGLTLRQAELLIEDKYAEFYNNPFVLLEVTNRRVMIFAGDNTSVVELVNDNMTLFEVLALSGGIPEDGKSKKIKIVRGDLRNPEIYLIDLSTLKGMRSANLVMQANDIVYIEVRKRYATKILQEIAPIIAILSTAISTIALTLTIRSIGGQ